MTVDLFLMRFPEFKDVDAGNIQLALDEARMLHNVRELVTHYFAAHILTVAKTIAEGNTGSTGAVKSDSVGNLRSEYVTQVVDGDIKAELATTAYGARGLLLESRTSRSRIGATIGGR